MTKITLGELPIRPERDKASGLTTKLWNGLTKCWHTKPEDRITIPEALELLNSSWVLYLVAQTVRIYVHDWIQELEQRTLPLGPLSQDHPLAGKQALRRLERARVPSRPCVLHPQLGRRAAAPQIIELVPSGGLRERTRLASGRATFV